MESFHASFPFATSTHPFGFYNLAKKSLLVVAPKKANLAEAEASLAETSGYFSLKKLKQKESKSGRRDTNIEGG